MHPTLISLSLAAATITLGFLFDDEAKVAQKPKPEPIEKETLALFDYDKDDDLELEEVNYVQQDGYSYSDMTFASPGGGRVPTYLFQPDGEGPYAGIVLMHGMPGSRESALTFARDYVQAGAVVIAISAPWARPDGPREEILRFDKRDRDEQVQLIQDLMRAVDILESLSTVDTERMAYAGGSYGGAMGGLLAGVEKRLKAYALVVGDGGLVAHSTGPEDESPSERGIGEAQWKKWLSLMRPIEPLRFVAHAAPAHLLFQNGRTDRLVPAADAEAYQAAGSEPKTILWYDGGHGITPERINDQLKWLSERIGITPKLP